MPDFEFSNDIGRARLIAMIQGLPIDRKWRFSWTEAKEKRRDAQNRLMWQWNNEIQRHMAETHGIIASADDWHETMCEKLMPVRVSIETLPDRSVVQIKSRWRSSKATVGEFSEYLNKLDAYCCQSLGLILPHPDDLYHAAMMERR